RRHPALLAVALAHDPVLVRDDTVARRLHRRTHHRFERLAILARDHREHALAAELLVGREPADPAGSVRAEEVAALEVVVPGPEPRRLHREPQALFAGAKGLLR